MPADILSRRDLDFLLFEWLRIDEVTARPRFAEHSRETFAPALDLCEQLAERYFATHNRLSDANEPRFEGGRVELIAPIGEALEQLARTGLLAATMDAAVGGMQLPAPIASACMAWFHAANPATSAYAMLTIAAANLLRAHGTDAQIARYVTPMTDGTAFGTMCLSEPEVGSALGDIRTRAERLPDGSYRLFGNKMWISGGEHDLTDNIVHLVLARVDGARPGVKGLSLFVVPKLLGDGADRVRNDVVLVGLNHKMGYRGTTNTLLAFGDGVHLPGGRAGAVGELVGEEGRGLDGMFHMMNEARIAVGLVATALGYTGFLKSLTYAHERRQGRPAGASGASDPVAIVDHADVRRMLLAQKSYAEGALGLILYCAALLDDEHTHPDDDQRARARLLLDVLTPIAKSWPSQWCLEANSLAIQVHGGYGYSRDFDVEQLYRDNRLNAIHEGTHGIQALDLLGRKVVLHDGAAFTALVDAIRATCRQAAEQPGQAAEHARLLTDAVSRLATVTALLTSSGDRAAALANASLYLEAAGHIVVAWIWLQQELAAAERSGPFYEGKRSAARYFFRYELPRSATQLDVLATLDRTTLDLDVACLRGE